MEDQLLQAALEFYHTDTHTKEIDILRDKAIFWETRARELEKKYTTLLQENSSKDDTIHHLNALLSRVTEERDNLCNVKDKLLSLSVATGLEEQLLKAKLHIAKLKEQQDDNEVLISQLKERIKVELM
jgi:hypothetical protein